MTTRPKVLGVIPARGGSKGVPRKNLRLVCGKPLIAYSIELALGSMPPLHTVVVSTDDAEIADASRQRGADVPFLRPTALATDAAPMLPTVLHALEFVEARDRITFDWVCLLQPTSPLRTTADIDACLRLAEQRRADSVISVQRVVANHPRLMKRIENHTLVPFAEPEIEGTRRQDLTPPAFKRNGAIYLTRRDVIVSNNSLWGDTIVPYEMPDERSVNVDSELDLALLELMLRSPTRA